MSGGKVKVVVRSRRVPVRTVEFAPRPASLAGPMMSPMVAASNGTPAVRGVVFESVLGEDHLKAIEEGHRIACSLGLELEVIDRAKSGLLGRMKSAFGLGGADAPDVVISPTHEAEPPTPRVMMPYR